MKTVLMFLILCTSMAMAGELYDLKLPDMDTVNGKKLVLNGMSYREMSILGIDIKVYVGGLYLEKKSKDGEEILNSKNLKYVKTVFKHRGSGKDIGKAWEDAYKEVCKNECNTKHKDHLEAFKKLFNVVKSGESLNYIFSPAGIEVIHDAEKWGTVADEDFGKVILSVWIGKDAVSQTMKKGFLGL